MKTRRRAPSRHTYRRRWARRNTTGRRSNSRGGVDPRPSSSIPVTLSLSKGLKNLPLPARGARGSWLVRGFPFEGIDALAELVVSLAKLVVLPGKVFE